MVTRDPFKSWMVQKSNLMAICERLPDDIDLKFYFSKSATISEMTGDTALCSSTDVSFFPRSNSLLFLVMDAAYAVAPYGLGCLGRQKAVPLQIDVQILFQYRRPPRVHEMDVRVSLQNIHRLSELVTFPILRRNRPLVHNMNFHIGFQNPWKFSCPITVSNIFLSYIRIR